MRPDPRQAVIFLRTLRAGKRATFQTFPEAVGAAGGPRILHGMLSANFAALERANLDGHGIFVMVNEGDGRGRAAKNVTRVRALFVDLDGTPLPPRRAAPLPPHLGVESSPGRFHLYWLTRDVPLGEFQRLQTAMAGVFAGDPAVKDLPRVMRLPGFMHRKGVPFLTRVLGTNPHEPYGLRDLVDGLPGLRARLEVLRRAPSRAPLDRGAASVSNRYARAALDAEIKTVASAPTGARNVTLNRAGFNLGQLVGAGLLEQDAALAALLSAAEGCGLSYTEALKTAQGALTAGKSNPRCIVPKAEAIARAT